ncbi:hypothetical protein V6N11_065532 [Hibiscus sabdariffa]|uniref:Uncharacterized protein n=1 Tax=Hibiscus sabdariffa TaxID=183260 RepID=A0ABR2PHR2_9ROSI
MPPPPGEDEDSWLDAMSTWHIALIGYASGLVVGLCIGYTVLNELGNGFTSSKSMGKQTKVDPAGSIRISVSKSEFQFSYIDFSISTVGRHLKLSKLRCRLLTLSLKIVLIHSIEKEEQTARIKLRKGYKVQRLIQI